MPDGIYDISIDSEVWGYSLDELTSSGFIGHITNYKRIIDTQEEIYSLGCYYQDEHWYKDFTWNINEQTTTFQVIMAIDTESQEPKIVVTCRSIVCQSEFKDVFRSFSNAIGIEVVDYDGMYTTFVNHVNNNDYNLKELFAEYLYMGVVDFTKFGIKCYLDPFGMIKEYSSTLLNGLYDYFLNEYPNIGNIYEYAPITRENGSYYISSFDNSNLASIFGGKTKDGNTSMNGYNSDGAYNLVKSILDKDDDLTKAIKESPIVRIGFRFVAPQTGRCIIDGFKILNNQIDVTNQGASMTGVVTGITHIEYSINGSNLTLLDSFTRNDISISEPFTNTYRQEWLDVWGMHRSGYAVESYNPVVDSIGWSASLAPYRIIDSTALPRPGTTRPQRYGDWGDTLSDPDIDPTPGPSRKGVIDPKKKTRKTSSEKDPTPPPNDEEEVIDVNPGENDVFAKTGICRIYDITDSELDKLGDWLWDSTNIERIVSIWKSNPLDSIISLKQIYCPPYHTEQGDVNVKIGEWDTNSTAQVVGSRYVKLEFGEKPLNRYFYDIRDYQTKVDIYLPFIGIKTLDIKEIMPSWIGVYYYCDILTGDCVAYVTSRRQNINGQWFKGKKVIGIYDGNCACDLPISQRNFNIVRTALSGGLSLANANITGAIGNLANTQSSVNKSGDFTSNKGAMGYKAPYLMISKPLPVDIVEKGRMIGQPCHRTLRLGDLSGYFKCGNVHLDTIGCTDEEKNLIEQGLKKGAIM